MANAPLRGCPTCGTPVAQASALGLRDYRWLSRFLPGNVAPSDLDSVLERNGNFLIHEYKPSGASIGMGQRIMLKQLVRKGFDVWVVWGGDSNDENSLIEVGAMDRHGDVKFVDKMPLSRLAERTVDWFEQASKDK